MATKKAGSVGEVPDEYMQCRAFRKHSELSVTERVAWRGSGKNRRPIQLIREEVCRNCGREYVVVYLLPSFEVMSRRTYYPDYYLVDGGAESIESKHEYVQRMQRMLPVGEEQPDRRRQVSTGNKGRGKR